VISKDSDSLLKFVSNVSGVDYRRIEEELGDGFVRLNIHEAERRQARHDIRNVEDIVVELLRNARDAKAEKIFLASHKADSSERRFVIVDDGCGIPARMQQKIFESRVTSKLDSAVFDDFGFHGRGMALYSIKCMVSSVAIIESQPGKGSIFEVSVDTRKIYERKDQSTFPVLIDRGRTAKLKGPHNTQRALAEFALSCPQIGVYYGSPAQILATMHSLGTIDLDDADQRHESNKTGLKKKYWQHIGPIADGAALARAAQDLFRLPVSERNAWRIASGDIEPLPDMLTILKSQKEGLQTGRASNLSSETNVTKYIPKEELEVLSKAIGQSIRGIEGKYFIKIQGKPKVTKSKNRIKVVIDLEPAED
jgi:hypothetical protein